MSESEMGMVERVARALAYDVRSPAVDDLSSDKYWAALSAKDHMEFEGNARAAIEAMAEPTREMVRAGHRAMKDEYDSDFGTGYRAALSAALSGEGELSP